MEGAIGQTAKNMTDLFNYLMRTYKLRNDTQIAWHIGVSQTMISELRSGKRRPTSDFILKVYDTTKLSLPRIRLMLGLPRGRGRL